MITWHEVDSSNVAQIAWDDVDGTPVMLVRFRNGQVYMYSGVSRQRASYIVSRCKSAGAYINRVIKPQFPSLRVPALD